MGALVAAAVSLTPGSSEAGEVSVNISLDEAFVELVRGSRRAAGIDPPDSAADRRLQAMLRRLDRQRGDTVSADPAARPGLLLMATPEHPQVISY